ncbi:SAM-dependent methyltransferase, MidA family [Paracoccus halophilus]|uniref:ATP synthase subunit beta n=1 Tax=Paracoccus halophilus TaxID=376733 RepID=A0A099F2F8_9RHOB|nr:SAM-dependent methyltransferase [Paracoccus halophilus]KGJ04599.1 ATP synthase subunit beta [Paracoccus halophilus]SFA50056.1 SAM-dependent methyltransferase, MidA family [Paracoccus halophilus]
MTPLARLIATQIAASGPMQLDEYMRLCLLHPQYGYYVTRDPFGAAGDFTTAPEISQMFGEMVGLALAQAWLDQGGPAPFTLAEIGPGRGTLMADILRAIRVVPGMGAAAEVTLIEASPRLRQVQRDRLGQVKHVETLSDIACKPLFLIANELFDALPIRQFQRQAEGWAEHVVTLNDAGELALGLAAPLPGPAAPCGQIRETCPQAPALAGQIARHIAAHGGCAIAVDYGNWHGQGDTLQALRRHRPEHPLANPGEADLTAHVDFEPLAQAARAAGANVSRMVTQGEWLLRLGIAARAQRLQAAGDAGAMAALHRLTAPGEMGHLFKALAFWPPGAPVPPGFEPLDDDAHDT